MVEAGGMPQEIVDVAPSAPTGVSRSFLRLRRQVCRCYTSTCLFPLRARRLGGHHCDAGAEGLMGHVVALVPSDPTSPWAQGHSSVTHKRFRMWPWTMRSCARIWEARRSVAQRQRLCCTCSEPHSACQLHSPATPVVGYTAT